MSTALQHPVSPAFQPDPGPADRGTTAPAASAPPPTPPPHPDQRSRAAIEPSPIARVITIVRWLIGYGTLLITAVRERPAEPYAQSIAYWFQTRDLSLIIRRLTRGLIRAAALEAWLRERAARGGHLRTTPMRLASLGKPRSGPQPDKDPRPAPWWRDPDHIPTPEEAAAEVRSRSHGAVMTDLCEELHVLDSVLDRPTLRELKDAIIRCGGNLARFYMRDFNRRMNLDWFMQCTGDPPPSWRAPPFTGWTPACARGP